VTVLYCDLVGSTGLSEQLDPEEFGNVVSGHQRLCAAAITRCGGHVASCLGDGVVVAYFGYPCAREDAAERAVRAGLVIVEAISDLKPGAGFALQVRIAITTGLVVTEEIQGAQGQVAIGKPLNLAARLQASVEPGMVVVADSTRCLVGNQFALEDLGGRALEGFSTPVRAWLVTGEGVTDSRFEALRGARFTPLLGRNEELALLLDRFEQAKEGEGQVVMLAGDPGIGKSRLVQALRDRLANEPHVDLGYYCSSYRQDSPLRPVIAHLERAAKFSRGDDPGWKLAKLEALLAQRSEDIARVAPLIASLLSIPSSGRYPPLDVSPQLKREQTLAALVDGLAASAAHRPVLLVWEDVHWADPTSLELLGLAIDRLQSLQILALITFRPEFAPPWPGHHHLTSLTLNRLSRRWCSRLATGLAGGKSLPAVVLDEIVTRADGVPLFVEELTKGVLESGLLREEDNGYELAGPLLPLSIPATLRDSLLTRLDRLGPVKEIAQSGAAIGREFSHVLLAAVTDRPEHQLRDALDRLISSQLVFRRGTPPEATYSFKHALVQDAAYGTLLKSRRQHLHARIAQALEEQFPEIAESQPALLAHHCTEAGLTANAVNHRRRAAQFAVAQSAHLEAIAEATKGLEALAGLPDGPERQRQELDLQLALGRGFLIAKGEAASETGSAYARAVELCAHVDAIPQMFQALYGRYFFHWARGELRLAHELAHQFLRIAQNQDDASARAKGTRIIGVISLYLGRPSAARIYLEQALEQSPGCHSTQAFIYPYHSRILCLGFMSGTFLTLGYPDQALSFVRQALAEAKVLGHPESIAYAMAETAGLYQDMRNVQAVQEQAEELIALATEQGHPHFRAEGRLYQAWALGQQGRVGEAIRQMRHAISVMRVAQKEIGMPYRLLSLAGMHLRARQVPDGLDVLTEALRVVESTGERWFEAELHRVRGELLLRSAAPPEWATAEECFRQAITVAQGQQAKLWELRAATSLARLWRGQGKGAQAHDLLAPVHDWFTEGFDTPDLREARALLHRLP
jgi:class 3 adenylate cyclase/predicted ATPase